MNILYVSSLCSKRKYKSLFGESIIKPGLAIQKYHKLMVEGFEQNKNIKITVLSAIPMSRKINNKNFFRKENEYICNTLYIYLSFFNIPILRHIYLFINSFLFTLKWCLNNKDGVIIGDILNISITSAACFAAKCVNRKSVGIVTDIPGYLVNNNKKELNILQKKIKKIITRINLFSMNKFDSYVFLTEQMNSLINKKNKKFVVIEGQVDINMKSVENTIAGKNKKKICMYAGSLKKDYGIKKLTEAFIKSNIKDSELHIYGCGNFEDELIEICKKHQNIKYMGVKDNDFIIKKQLEATLLINPRPTNEEYTKYSFPSKNMEYMVSGTPVLTTKLSGMPKEYYNYVYLIENESLEDIEEYLKNILNKSKLDMHAKGIKAKKFVIKEKNNKVQAKKIIKMIKF